MSVSFHNRIQKKLRQRSCGATLGGLRFNVNPEVDLDGQQKSAKGKARQQTDRDFEACARLNERKSEERISRHSGNCYMLTNGVWSYTWDAENRLTAVYSNDNLLVSNVYDHQSRRIAKIISRSGPEVQRKDFLYDGWNLIRELITNNGSLTTNSYTWGLDLSGSLQGAGGVGGLLAVQRDSAVYLPCFDANGNVTDYIDASGTLRAHYAFDAFGNNISQSGELVDIFNNRFSTKHFDAETGMYYYGYRFYLPELGRWLNRDPFREMGGLNLNALKYNDVLNNVDRLGLYISPIIYRYNTLASHKSKMPV
jgi:RHS repeat-associated protein